MALAQLSGDAGFAVSSIHEISLRQELVPAHLLGRVNASMHILAHAMMPVGALLAGLLSRVIGIRAHAADRLQRDLSGGELAGLFATLALQVNSHPHRLSGS